MDGVGIKVIGIGTVGNDVLNKIKKKRLQKFNLWELTQIKGIWIN